MGGGLIVYSLLTESERGAVPLIGMPAHLMLDGLSGLFLASSPWLLGFAYLVWVPHLALGLAMLGLATITKPMATRRTWDTRQRPDSGVSAVPVMQVSRPGTGFTAHTRLTFDSGLIFDTSRRTPPE